MNVHITLVTDDRVLAYVDNVRVTAVCRATMLPAWRCRAHPSEDGRVWCPHIGALAATPTDYVNPPKEN